MIIWLILTGEGMFIAGFFTGSWRCARSRRRHDSAGTTAVQVELAESRLDGVFGFGGKRP